MECTDPCFISIAHPWVTHVIVGSLNIQIHNTFRLVLEVSSHKDSFKDF